MTFVLAGRYFKISYNRAIANHCRWLFDSYGGLDQQRWVFHNAPPVVYESILSCSRKSTHSIQYAFGRDFRPAIRDAANCILVARSHPLLSGIEQSSARHVWQPVGLDDD